MSDPGIYEGDTCNRQNCQGAIDCHPVENCSCHISPPCGACTAPRNFCAKCGWEEADEEKAPTPSMSSKYFEYKPVEPRPLDPTKIDWRIHLHTHFSMICEGVYPEGATATEVLEKVRGTFGGRFEYFGNGKFKYIAYTD